ncbi:MAG: SEC-C metal-binding domain-containing protein [Vicinamibacterales bacterium]
MAKIGRNDPCHCNSGKKYKRCCEAADLGHARQSNVMLFVVGGAILAALAAGVVSFTTESAPAGRVWSAEHGHYHDAMGNEVP